ncbi:MAG: TolC family protein [Clostridiales bacterium]
MHNNSKTKKLVFLSLLGVLAIPISLFSQVLTLENAVELALRNNEKIKQFEERTYQKKYQDMEAWGNFMPSIGIEGSYTHLNENMNIDLSPIRDVMITLQGKTQAELASMGNVLQGKAPYSQAQKDLYSQAAMSQLNQLIPPFVETFKKQNYRTATIVGIQPIFLGGKLMAAKDFASEERQSSEIELQKTRNEVMQEAVNNYLSTVLMQNVVKTRKDVLDGINKHKNDAQKLYNEGLIANYHLLRAEVAVADAERNLSDDLNKLELAEIALKNTLGIPEDSQINVSDTLIYSGISDSLNTFLSLANQNQPILRLIEMKKEAAKSKYVAERAGFLPTIAAFGKYEMYPEYLSSLEPRWAVGVQVKFNLFNGMKDYAKLQNAVHIEREVQYVEADAKRKIGLWVNKSYRDVVNARTRYEKLGKTIDLAKESLRLNEKRFISGMGTSLEVIDAQLSLERNQIESLNSLYEYYKSLTDLFVATGNPQDILRIWHKEK